MGQALSWLAENPSVRSVVLAGLWVGPITNRQESYRRVEGTSNDDGATLLSEGLQDAILELRGAGKQVFVAEDTPYWPFDPVKAMRSRSIPLRNKLQRLVEQNFDTSSPAGVPYAPMTEVETRVRRTAEESKARYIFTRRWLCVSDSCLYRKGELPLFADQSHLTLIGARIVIERYRSLFLDESHTEFEISQPPPGD